MKRIDGFERHFDSLSPVFRSLDPLRPPDQPIINLNDVNAFAMIPPSPSVYTD